jgi:hypothetical protein
MTTVEGGRKREIATRPCGPLAMTKVEGGRRREIATRPVGPLVMTACRGPPAESRSATRVALAQRLEPRTHRRPPWRVPPPKAEEVTATGHAPAAVRVGHQESADQRPKLSVRAIR